MNKYSFWGWFVVAFILAYGALAAVWQYTRVRYVEKELSDGSFYRGEWCRAMMHGKGELNYADGGRYVGYFVRDTMHGRGQMYYADGAHFRGVWQMGLRQGKGVLCLADSASIYDGEWQGDTLVSGVWSTDTTRYEGFFREFLPDGEGVLRQDNGEEYVGRWLGGKRHGVGRKSNPTTNEFEFGYWCADSLCVPEGKRYEFGQKVYGIDVSHHQKHITWGDLALYCDARGEVYHQEPQDTTYLQPVWFAMIKSTEGATYQDPRYARNVAEARKYGLIKGSYHYLRMTSTIPDQVNNYILNTEWSKGDFPPILDIEVAPEEVELVGKERYQELILQWLDAVEAYYGVQPIIYTYIAYKREFLTRKEFDKYDVWLARYSDKRPKRHKWMIWQFSDSGRISGIEPIVDLNLYDGDIEEMREYLIGCQ